MDNLIGKDLGRYHILEQLGEGGMATVYKAYDLRLERNVAIKVIRVDQFAPAVLERVLKRFEREAKALARLTQTNIVHINDYGEQDGIPFLVMDYLPGGTLKELLKGQPMSWQEAAHLLIPVARALDYAHRQGMIHRDVKPSNILITADGEPMLTDFGIAKIIDDEATVDLTGTSATVGTPEYMAPEQVTSKTVDQRADIYSLGVVFYEMVTGRKPFQADTPMAVLFKQASEPLPRPEQFVPDLPEGVEQVLIKALAKKREERYPDMAAFAHALEQLSHGETVSPKENKAIAQELILAKGVGVKQPSFESSGTIDEINTILQPESTTDVVNPTMPVEFAPLPPVQLLGEDSKGTIDQGDRRVTSLQKTMLDEVVIAPALAGQDNSSSHTLRKKLTLWSRGVGIGGLMIFVVLVVVLRGGLLNLGEKGFGSLAGLATDTPTATHTLTPTFTLTFTRTNVLALPTYTMIATQVPLISPTITPISYLPRPSNLVVLLGKSDGGDCSTDIIWDYPEIENINFLIKILYPTWVSYMDGGQKLNGHYYVNAGWLYVGWKVNVSISAYVINSGERIDSQPTNSGDIICK